MNQYPPADYRLQEIFKPEEIQQLKDSAQTLRTLMAKVRQLSLEERKALPRVGDRAEVFFVKGRDYAISDPDFGPRYFDVPALSADVEAAELADQLFRPVSQALDQLSDCRKLSRAAAYDKARTYYKGSQLAMDQKRPGAEHVATDLGRAFAGQGPGKASDVPPAPEPAPASSKPPAEE